MGAEFGANRDMVARPKLLHCTSMTYLDIALDMAAAALKALWFCLAHMSAFFIQKSLQEAQ